MRLNSNTAKQIILLLCTIGILTLFGNHVVETNNKRSALGDDHTRSALQAPDVPPVKPQPVTPPPQPKPAPPPPQPAPMPEPPQPSVSDCAQVQCVALTFDDGPSPHTPRLLDLLDKTHAKATFFMLGVYVERHAEIVRRVVRDEHQIGNHTWLHHNLTMMTDDEISSEIRRTNEVISRVAGVEPAIMRPPFGATDERLQQLVKLPQILWNVDSYDWRDKDPAAVADRIISGAKPGAIILAHDIYPSTIDAVPRVVEVLRGKGYHFVTVAELLGAPVKPGVYWSQRDFTAY